MRDILFPFQEMALSELHTAIDDAHMLWRENKPQVVSFSAPTGSGKTIIMTALIEEILYGYADGIGDPDAVFIWLSDSPELNEQTRLKIERKSDIIRTNQLIVIDSIFDAEYLEGGNIYFLNTQKLGSEKLLTQEGDDRTYKIWQTIENTAQRIPQKLYVAIDEAHRGTYASTQAEKRAQSIMQKFILGSTADGLSPMPLVIGITATPQRLEKLLTSATSTVQKVIIQPELVRESGLLKDRIILHYPDIASSADMAMFKGAVENWQKKCFHWKSYCEREKERIVKPIFVVQVEDGNDRISTHTDIGICIELLEESLKRKLIPGEVVHTFNDHGAITVRGVEIRWIEASRIEEETAIVVFFKMNLSTGWDCPRAETMMSFRRAHDFTYIAQLLGRMIRTPLARRVASDAELNSVSLFLPYFNEQTVQDVVKALRDNDEVTSISVSSHKDSITLSRNLAFSDVFKAMNNLVTYKVDTARKQPPLRLLIQLSRALTMDGIDKNIQRAIKKEILVKMDTEIARIKESGNFDKRAENITGFALSSATFDFGSDIFFTNNETTEIESTKFDIARHFEHAGKLLGEGLHIDYWTKHSQRDHLEVIIEIIILVNDTTAMENLNSYAETQFLSIYNSNKRAITRLSEVRKLFYERMVHASAQLVDVPWELPLFIDFSLEKDRRAYDNHLYCNIDGIFETSLNEWEHGLVDEEFRNGAVCWLRNIDRKTWSLEIPYEINGIVKPMYPDMLTVTSKGGEYTFHILEPHDPERNDNYPKAVGLAKFAERHGGQFGRIQLIRKERGYDGKSHFVRLDMNNTKICHRVRRIISNSELDLVFKEYGTRKD